MVMKCLKILACLVVALSSSWGFAGDICVTLPLNPDGKICANDMLLVNVESDIPISKVDYFLATDDGWEKLESYTLANANGCYSVLWGKGTGFAFSKRGIAKLRVASHGKAGEILKTQELSLEVLANKIDFAKNYKVFESVLSTLRMDDVVAISPDIGKAIGSLHGSGATYWKYLRLLELTSKLNAVLDKYIAKTMPQIQGRIKNGSELHRAMIEKLAKSGISSEMKKPLSDLREELEKYADTFLFCKFFPNIIYAEAYGGFMGKAKKDYDKFYSVEKNLAAKSTLRELFVDERGQASSVKKRAPGMESLRNLESNIFDPTIEVKKKKQMFEDFTSHLDMKKIDDDIVAELTMLAVYLVHESRSPILFSYLFKLLPARPSQTEKGIIKFYKEFKAPLCNELKKRHLRLRCSYYLNPCALLVSFVAGNKNSGRPLLEFYKQESGKKDNLFMLLRQSFPDGYDFMMKTFQKRFNYHERGQRPAGSVPRK